MKMRDSKDSARQQLSSAVSLTHLGFGAGRRGKWRAVPSSLGAPGAQAGRARNLRAPERFRARSSPPIQCAHSGEVLVAFREVARGLVAFQEVARGLVAFREVVRGLVAFQEVACHLRRPACALLLLPCIVHSNEERFRATTEHRLSFLVYLQ